MTDGPYGETHELFNGFWILEVSSKEEAVEWASRAPLGPGSKLEVRRIPGEEDFADSPTTSTSRSAAELRAERPLGGRDPRATP